MHEQPCIAVGQQRTDVPESPGLSARATRKCCSYGEVGLTVLGTQVEPVAGRGVIRIEQEQLGAVEKGPRLVVDD